MKCHHVLLAICVLVAATGCDSGNRRVIHPHRGYIGGLCFGRDEQVVVSAGGDDQRLVFSDTSDGSVLKCVDLSAGCVALYRFPSDDRIAVSTLDRRTEIRRLADGSLIRSLDTEQLCEFGGMSAFHDDLAVAPFSTGVAIWDLSSGAKLRKLDGCIGPVSYSRNGRILITGRRGSGDLLLWNTSNWTVEAQLHHGELQNLLFACSPISDVGVSAGVDGVLKFWNLKTGDLLRVVSTNEQVADIAFSPDGQYLAVATWAGANVCRLIRVSDGETDIVYRKYDLALWHISFGSQGRTLAIAGGSSRSWIFLRRNWRPQIRDANGGLGLS